MNSFTVVAASALLLGGVSGSAHSAPAPKAGAAATSTASAQLKTADGKDVGTATLTQTRGGVRIALALKGLPPGEHAFHLHGVEKCKPNSVLQDNGTAVVIHAGKDDYKTDPAGNAGDRIACGVITEGKATA